MKLDDFYHLKGQVQSWLQASNNTGILNTCTQLWLTESEQATPVDSIKDVVWRSVKVPEFDRDRKNAGGHISQNVVEITVQIVIGASDGEELIALQSLRVPWAWKFLIKLKILLLFGNVLKLNFPQYLAWTILKDFDLLLHCPKHEFVIFGWIYQNVTYFLAIIWKEKENKVNREDQRGHCFVSTIVKHSLKIKPYLFLLEDTKRSNDWKCLTFWNTNVNLSPNNQLVGGW